jgi:hypothetical protein
MRIANLSSSITRWYVLLKMRKYKRICPMNFSNYASKSLITKLTIKKAISKSQGLSKRTPSSKSYSS